MNKKSSAFPVFSSVQKVNLPFPIKKCFALHINQLTFKFSDFEDEFLMNGETADLGGCKGCRMDLEGVSDRELLVHASRFMKLVPIRLHNLREFEDSDVSLFE